MNEKKLHLAKAPEDKDIQREEFAIGRTVNRCYITVNTRSTHRDYLSLVVSL